MRPENILFSSPSAHRQTTGIAAPGGSRRNPDRLFPVFSMTILSSNFTTFVYLKNMAKFIKHTDCQDCRKKNDLFCSLTREQLAKMNENKYEVHYNPGETIFKQGASLTHLGCITEGLVKVYLEGYNRKNLILKLARAGEIIGGPGLLIDFRHHYTAAAVEDTSVCFVDVHMFTENFKVNPEFAEALLKKSNMAAVNNFERMISYTQKQMPGRGAETILYLYRVVYKTNPFYLTISRQELAELGVMSKESMIRLMKEFKEAGFIGVEGNRVEILNEKALQNISETG